MSTRDRLFSWRGLIVVAVLAVLAVTAGPYLYFIVACSFVHCDL